MPEMSTGRPGKLLRGGGRAGQGRQGPKVLKTPTPTRGAPPELTNSPLPRMHAHGSLRAPPPPGERGERARREPPGAIWPGQAWSPLATGQPLDTSSTRGLASSARPRPTPGRWLHQSSVQIGRGVLCLAACGLFTEGGASLGDPGPRVRGWRLSRVSRRTALGMRQLIAPRFGGDRRGDPTASHVCGGDAFCVCLSRAPLAGVHLHTDTPAGLGGRCREMGGGEDGWRWIAVVGGFVDHDRFEGFLSFYAEIPRDTPKCAPQSPPEVLKITRDTLRQSPPMAAGLEVRMEGATERGVHELGPPPHAGGWRLAWRLIVIRPSESKTGLHSHLALPCTNCTALHSTTALSLSSH